MRNSYTHTHTYTRTERARATRKYDDKRHGARYDIIDPLERNARTFLWRALTVKRERERGRKREREREREGGEARYARFVQLHELFNQERIGSSINSISKFERTNSQIFFPCNLLFPPCYHYARSNFSFFSSSSFSSFFRFPFGGSVCVGESL